jgi:hypothetical protein
LPPQSKKSAAIASAKFVVAEHKAALVYWSFGFRLPRGSSAKAVILSCFNASPARTIGASSFIDKKYPNLLNTIAAHSPV